MAHWSLGLGSVDRLIRFRQLYQQGYPVFPDSDYAKQGLTPEQLNEAAFDAQARQLFHEQRTVAKEHLSKAMQSNDTKTILPIQRLGRLRIAQLQLWEHNDVNHYRSYATLTPVKKAWITLIKRKP